MADQHTEAAIWAEGTPYTADELLRGYRDWRAAWNDWDGEPESFEWWCENVMKIANDPQRQEAR